MSDKDQAYQQPPKPPDIPRKFQFHRVQLIGMPLIMLIPILALLGLFGKTIGSESAANLQLGMHVTYPTRFRYKMMDQASISIQNLSAQIVPTVTVRLERDYVEAFSDVAFTPDVKSVTETAYEDGLRSGTDRLAAPRNAPHPGRYSG